MGAHTKLSNMRSKRGAALAAAALIAVPLIGANALPSAAQESPPPIGTGIGTEVLTPRATFTDDVSLKLTKTVDGEETEVAKAKDASRTVVARITVQPRAQFPWHTHPGPVVANVAQGKLTYVDADDCAKRDYPAGTAFVDAGGDHVHSAFNPTNEPTVVVATFFKAPETGALTLPIPPEEAPADNCQIIR
jgi:quercetin dioxygenase-like cupin family protein